MDDTISISEDGRTLTLAYSVVCLKGEMLFKGINALYTDQLSNDAVFLRGF